jgi:DNA primase
LVWAGVPVTSFDRTVRDILERVSLVQVISEFVPLKKAGRTYKGLCPFHQEKTPSFNVNEEKRVFYCFGCQTGGNAITFLTMAAGLSKREAIQRLSQLAGIPLPQEKAPDPAEDAAARERADLLHAIGAAAEHFRQALAGPDGARAREYLESRGIGHEVAEAYGLGFGGVRRGDLVAAFERRKVPLRHAETAGLIARGHGPTDVFERFLGRLVCPVYNLDGAVIAFSARLIPPVDEGPKYVNSPDSVVFQKGEALFGLHQARKTIRHAKAAIMVEGNFDVLSLAAAGIGNVVAPLGTSLTTHQLRLLRRFTEDVTVMFDGDEAGRKASRRAVGLLIEAGIAGRVASLPAGEDPDSLARGRGSAGVEDAVARARPMITYLLEALVETHGRTPHGLRKVVEDAREVFDLERDAFRHGLYREELARVLGVDVREVRRLLREPGAVEAKQAAARAWPPLEERLLELMVLSPRFVSRWLDEQCSVSWVTHPEARDLLAELISLVVGGTEDPAEALVGGAETGGALRAKVARVLAAPETYPEATQDYTYAETIAGLQEAALKREKAEVQMRLSAAAGGGADVEEMNELMMRLSRIQARIQELARGAIRQARPVDA